MSAGNVFIGTRTLGTKCKFLLKINCFQVSSFRHTISSLQILHLSCLTFCLTFKSLPWLALLTNITVNNVHDSSSSSVTIHTTVSSALKWRRPATVYKGFWYFALHLLSSRDVNIWNYPCPPSPEKPASPPQISIFPTFSTEVWFCIVLAEV